MCRSVEEEKNGEKGSVGDEECERRGRKKGKEREGR